MLDSHLRYTTRGLLAGLGARPTLAPDDADPAAFYDPADGVTWISETKRGGPGSDLAWAFVTISDAGLCSVISSLRAVPVRAGWRVASFALDGQPVAVKPEVAVGFAAAIAGRIRAGRPSDVAALAAWHIRRLRLQPSR